jgi:hypothetical protein
MEGKRGLSAGVGARERLGGSCWRGLREAESGKNDLEGDI